MSLDDPQKQPGLVVTVTEPIRLFLISASNDPRLSEDLRKLALTLSSQSNAPYKHINSIWVGSDVHTRPSLKSLFSGSGFVFDSPKPREKSAELQERLRKLQELAERKEYQELVKDITPKKEYEPFSTYKDQLGFGLHVALTMFTGYLVGYLAFRALFNHSPAMNAAGGILGLVLAMLVETLLFIIRTSDPGLKSPSSTSSRLKKDQ
ncbi:ATPase, vacuolar ER assembly factor, Vma12 [Corchorus olitorius]|uniref:ATPase, vacuolar ER assembly factor, Vma12 n=1 Tax=Corchorus olitorius TaxID=93759 RepID=A0A1R3JEP5_9ROSI|nr:ATPase, vacuolar ER assembly factor, Vma12 [Corchorus olitorius]